MIKKQQIKKKKKRRTLVFDNYNPGKRKIIY